MEEFILAAPGGAADDALCLDFEIRTALDLRTSSAHRWCHHASAELLCAAYRLPGDPAIRAWRRGEPVPTAVVQHMSAGRPVRAWNAMFEFEVTQTAAAQALGWPRLTLNQLDCSMARAAACGLPQGLDACGQVLGLTVTKDVRGSVLMRSIVNPKRSGQPIADEAMDGLVRYCLQDVAAEMAITAILPPLTVPEAELWRLNARINQRGLPIDVPMVERAEAAARATLAALDAEMAQVTGGAVPAASAVARLKDFLGAQGVAGFADLDLRDELEDAA
ncbi:hypothetical protein [Roseicella sp. DB1501]|uniref:hypothetical protein n=1 Tax=Roseicella sp. DB1501 TaxID=2730925 RepID=UPI001490A05A|nr:hypothetical protein [Roseicella sp. DB1501]NOG69783.1 hypothetical protein [Roseicella sp. DB1501]